MDKNNIYLDLSKCSEGEIKNLRLKNSDFSSLEDLEYFTNLCSAVPILSFDGFKYEMSHINWIGLKGKTEISFTAFKEMLGSGEEYPGQRYQPLFDHLDDEHGLILHEREMDEIIRIVNELNSNQ